MNKAAKRRLVIVGIAVIAIALALFAVLGSGGTATSLSVAQAVSGDYAGKKVQVSGAVVQDSYTSTGSVAVFEICDDTDATKTLNVEYSGAMPATFGNGVTAICTGMLSDKGLTCTTMITKCPSKYESAEGSVTVGHLLSEAGVYNGTEIKLAGFVSEGTLASADADIRFEVNSQGGAVDVAYAGALPEGLKEGSAVIVTGAYAAERGVFEAVDVALDASVQDQAY